MKLKSSGKRKIRRQVLLLTTALSRWCQVKADILFAFEQAKNAGLSPELKNEIESMLTRIRGGMPTDQALRRFGEYSEQEQFQELVAAVRTSVRHRGNIPALLESMEIQFFKLEEAYQQRRISSRSEFRSTVLCLFATATIFAVRFGGNKYIRMIFLSTDFGVLLLILSAISFATGLVATLFLYCRIND